MKRRRFDAAAVLCACVLHILTAAMVPPSAAAEQTDPGGDKSPEAAAVQRISLPATDYVRAEGAELQKADGLIWRAGSGRITWRVEIPQTARYSIRLEYALTPENNNPLEIGLMLDGRYPFDTAEPLNFPRNFEDDGEKWVDAQGNEFAPPSGSVRERYIEAPYDISGFITSYSLELSEGTHELTLLDPSVSLTLYTVLLCPPETTQSYAAYAETHRDAVLYSGEPLVMQGEEAAWRTKKSITAQSDKTSALVTPSDATVNLLNYIGGKNWNSPGDAITWELQIEKSGLYALSFRFLQEYVLNATFYRRLLVDGEQPFAEAAALSFSYGGNWQNTTFSDREGTPYLLYLEEGKHTLTLQATLGPLAPICARLDTLINELAAFYREMVMICGETPDANRDYNLFDQIENYQPRLESFMTQLGEITASIEAVSEQGSSSAITTLRNMDNVLRKMLDQKYYAHQYKSRYYDNYASLSAWRYSMTSMPLGIDAVILSGPDDETADRRVSLGDQAWFSFKRFISSFLLDYRGTTDHDQKPLTLWINTGRDQASLLKHLIESDFTVQSDIPVYVRVTNATLLQGILSGNGPDCAILQSRSTPVNLAMRGGLYDLSRFEDYKDVVSRFALHADMPYVYNGGHYALPDTQNFFMLFYRTDIFKQMRLSVPQTWEEFLNTSILLLRKNMQVGLPYVSISNMAVADAGVGALSIYPTMLLQQGVSLYNADLTRVNLMDPTAKATFRTWTDYYRKYAFPQTYDFYSRFRVGLMPMAVQSYSMYATLTAAAPEIRSLWKMAPIPGVRQKDGSVNRVEAGGGTGCCILADSDHPQGAWAFLKWWTSADTQNAYATGIENALGASARHLTSNEEALQMLDWDQENLSALMDQWAQVEEIPEIPGSYYMARSIDQAFWNTVSAGEDAQEMLLKWSTVADREIVRKGEQYRDE